MTGWLHTDLGDPRVCFLVPAPVITVFPALALLAGPLSRDSSLTCPPFAWWPFSLCLLHLRLPVFIDFSGIFHSTILWLFFLSCFYNSSADCSLQNISMKTSGGKAMLLTHRAGSVTSGQGQVWEAPCKNVFQNIIHGPFKCNTFYIILFILNNNLSKMHFVLLCLKQSVPNLIQLFLNDSGHLSEACQWLGCVECGLQKRVGLQVLAVSGSAWPTTSFFSFFNLHPKICFLKKWF